MSVVPESTSLPSAPSQATALLRALLVADLVDSTALVERLGDAAAAEILREHDRLVRRLIQAHGGQEIDKTDGFLVMFERPVWAVAFAVAYQRELAELASRSGHPLRARVGVHFGEVMVWQNAVEDVARGAKPIEVEGLAKPVAARLMSLALPGQVLVTGITRDLVQRAIGELGDRALDLAWRHHGEYRLKGVREPLAIHEIGARDSAPFRAPVWTGKAHRATPWWRRPGVIAIQLLLLLGLALPLWSLLRPPDAIAFAERDWVVLADLQNLTGDSRFDLSLSVAARVLVEQSQHVNVLSPLRVSDALQRMGVGEGAGLDPDRAAEIALREGARAVLLPSIREVGEGFEFAIDVLDPGSARTVYRETALAANADGVLAAVGTATEQVRGRLGEALANIEQSSAPVPQVTSRSLDALRAYAIGVEHYNRLQFDAAEAQFRQALALDSGFALAIAQLGRVRLVHNDLEGALQLTEQAHALRERLTSREAWFLDARLAQLRFERGAVGAWDALVELYPDFHQALHNASIMHYIEGRYWRVAELATRASVPQSVTKPVSTFMLGLARLAEGDIETAVDQFEQASALGFGGFSIEPAGALMAQGRVDDAFARLHATPPPNEFLRRKRLLAELAMRVDAGRWDEVDASHQRLRDEIAALAEPPDIAAYRQLQAFRFALLGTRRGLESAPERSAGLLGMVDEALARHESAPTTSRSDTVLVLLYLGWQLAREGQLEQASRLLQASRAAVTESPRSLVADAAAALEARLALAAGEPARALTLLEARRSGAEILLVRALRIEALRRAGQLQAALQSAEELAGSRGRAYAEWGGEGMTLVENAVQINLALLTAAEIALEASEPERARAHLQAFLARWPEFDGLEGLGPRVTALKQRLQI